MPGAVPRTSTLALANATLPYGLKLASTGVEGACAADKGLMQGLNCYDGKCTYPGVAEALGLEAWGVAAEGEDYFGQSYRNAREVLARVKDVLYCAFQPEPTYLGEAIPVWGDGNATNDR